MRRKIRKAAFNNMSLHSVIRTLNIDVKSSGEDEKYYYIETDANIGTADSELDVNDIISVNYTVKFNKRFDVDKAIYKFEREYKCTVIEHKFKVQKEKKFNIHYLEIIAKVNEVIECKNSFRASYGFNYMIKKEI